MQFKLIKKENLKNNFNCTFYKKKLTNTNSYGDCFFYLNVHNMI